MWKIAWRSLWRNRTRTLVTASAIAMTYGLYLFMTGIQEYSYFQMGEAASKAAGGSVLVQGAGFLDSQGNDLFVPNPKQTLRDVRTTAPNARISPRLIINGLLSTSASSAPVRLQGVDPALESPFQDVAQYVTAGSFLAGNESDPIVLGAAIVSELDLEVGDRVVLTMTDHTGEMRRALFHLTGVLTTGAKLTDSSLAFTTLGAARDALGLPDVLSQIGVLTVGPPDMLAASIAASLREQPDVEVLTWREAMPDMVGFIEMDRAYGDLFAVILFLVVLLAITNTFLMAVMERVREFGLLQALGLTPARLGLLVLLETFFLAAVAMGAGLVLGFLAHAATAYWGIDMTVFYGDSFDIAGVALTDTMLYSKIDPRRWFVSSVNVLLMVLLSAAYPAYKAMRLRPAEAMRFYE